MAINRLSRRQAVAITLRVFEELPYQQIAAAMDCTEATARKHVERARGHLRVVLAKHEPNRIVRS
ncbi:MAG: RNA polymerase sigma factor [Isosphaerales bacterium]